MSRIYGQFLEHINHSLEDGLFAEQIRGAGFEGEDFKTYWESFSDLGQVEIANLAFQNGAAGLFHRAAAQSGGGGNIPSSEQQKELMRLMMKDLGLASNDIASLQKIEWAKLMAAGTAAAAKINPPGPPMMGPGTPGMPRVGWSPCVDGKAINMRSFFDAAPGILKNVPILIDAGSPRRE